MDNYRKTQKGQVIVLFALAVVGLVAITALAIDTSNVYSERRHAQTAADNASLAGARAIANKIGNGVTQATFITNQNKYGDEPDEQVTIVSGGPFVNCNGTTLDPVNHADIYDKAEYYIEVTIRSGVDTYFGPIVGIRRLDSCVYAIARGKPFMKVPPFNGNAVVGFDPNGNSFDAGSNSQVWTIYGGGIFANHDADDSHAQVVFPDGDCVTAVGSTTGFESDVCQHPNSTAQFLDYPDDILAMMPPTPECDGEASIGPDDMIHPEPGYEERGSVWMEGFGGDIVNFAPGLYCMPDIGSPIHEHVQGNGVTFYISDLDFTMKYSGGGDFNVSAPTTGRWEGLLMFSPYTPKVCDWNNKGQNVDIRGNGTTPISGTIFMPSACIDWRGNGEGDAINSSIYGYQITSNGTADVNVYYSPDDGWKFSDPPKVELTR